MVLLWASLNGRTRKWALQPEHWTVSPRPCAFLSEGQFSRRVAMPKVSQALQAVLQQACEALTDDSSVAIADGTPVLVGGASRDEQAKAGRAVGGFGRGYRIHAVTTPPGGLLAVRVTPLNANEGRELMERAPELPSRIRRVLADGSYDSGTVHRALDVHHIRLIAPVKAGRVGRRQDPYRVAALKYLSSSRGKHAFKTRSNIERFFGNFKSHPLGLQGLPSWVRGLNRVRLWIIAKLTCWLATKILKQQKTNT